jgi:hypothetical protein
VVVDNRPGAGGTLAATHAAGQPADGTTQTAALREADARLGTLDLAGCTLATSCEPCALCVAGCRSPASAASSMPPRWPTAPAPWLPSRPGAPIGQGRIPARQTLVADAVAAPERRADG